MANLQSTEHHFFTASHYAVAGASSNTSKFGYKLLKWYNDRHIPVTPVTPTSDEILGLKCIRDISQIQDKRNTSLNVVTPPKVSKGILQQALEEGSLNGIWLQPGAEDNDVIEYIQSNQWLKERTIYGGPCVLVLGDRLRQDISKGKL